MKKLHALLAAALLTATAHASAQDQIGRGTVHPAGCPVRGYAMVQIFLDGAPYMHCAKLVFGLPEPKGGETVIVKLDAFSGEYHIIEIEKKR